MNQRCTICGFVTSEEVPPPRCPECGARDAMFEPTDEPPHGIAHNPFQPQAPLHADVLGPGSRGCVDED